MKKFFIAGLLLLLLPLYGRSQSYDTIVTKARIVDGDTIPELELSEVAVSHLPIPSDPAEAKKLAILIRNVKKVYPYARLAGIRFKEYNAAIVQAKSAKERKVIINSIEDEVKNKYGPELKNLSFSQGKILIKLLDRETGNPSYTLVKEMRGAFMAFFYQGFARLWGYDLKARYDPDGADRDIEMIVKLIENGTI